MPQVVKNLPTNAGNTGDMDSTLGSGRSPEKKMAMPLQYNCLGNPMDIGVWLATFHGVTRSRR